MMKKDNGVLICNLLLIAGGLHRIYLELSKGEGRAAEKKWSSLFLMVMNAVKTAVSGELRDGVPMAAWSGLFLLNCRREKEKE